jgi:hypothetical protein
VAFVSVDENSQCFEATEYVWPQTGVRNSLNMSKQKNATKVALKKVMNSVE